MSSRYISKKAPGMKVKRRECLRCEKPFKAETQFIRLCSTCRKYPDGVHCDPTQVQEISPAQFSRTFGMAKGKL